MEIVELFLKAFGTWSTILTYVHIFATFMFVHNVPSGAMPEKFPPHIFDLQSNYLFGLRDSISKIWFVVTGFFVFALTQITDYGLTGLLLTIVVFGMKSEPSKIPPANRIVYYFMNEAVLYTILLQACISNHGSLTFFAVFDCLLSLYFSWFFTRTVEYYDYYVKHPVKAERDIPNRYRHITSIRDLYASLYQPGFLFRLVTSPNLLCRIVQCAHFAMMAKSQLGWAHAYMVFAFCVAKAYDDHIKKYRPKGLTQKAILPYLL